jgi:hypothetical protein
VFFAVVIPAWEKRNQAEQFAPAPILGNGRTVAEIATHDRPVGEWTCLLTPPSFMGFDLAGTDAAPAKFGLDDVDGLGFHSGSKDGHPVQQIFRSGLPGIFLDSP